MYESAISARMYVVCCIALIDSMDRPQPLLDANVNECVGGGGEGEVEDDDSNAECRDA